MAKNMLDGAQVIVDYLIREKVPYAFGLCGHGNIQFDDEPEELGRDDHQAFSDKEVAWSLSLCIRVLKHLGERFPRPEALGVFAHEVSIPKASSRTGTSSRAGLSSRPGPPADERSMGGVRGLLVGSSSPEKRWLEECYPR